MCASWLTFHGEKMAIPICHVWQDIHLLCAASCDHCSPQRRIPFGMCVFSGNSSLFIVSKRPASNLQVYVDRWLSKHLCVVFKFTSVYFIWHAIYNLTHCWSSSICLVSTALSVTGLCFGSGCRKFKDEVNSQIYSCFFLWWEHGGQWNKPVCCQ